LIRLLATLLLATSTLAQQSGPPLAFNEPLGSFFALSVKDLNASSAWYQQKLGFKVVKQGGVSPDGKSSAMILDRDGFVLELVHHKQAVNGNTLRKDYKPYLVYGIFKVGLIVDDADHTAQRLRANGVPIANDPFTDEALHMRSFIIRDNEGNYIQFFSKVSG
jgi:catechol 2,3-dioxygenase-like lactoylglutathione lyase family enzyme